MELNQAGIDLIKNFEKCRLEAYPDPATKGAPYTIGWGHAIAGGMGEHATWTQQQADDMLTADLNHLCAFLRNSIHIMLSSNEFSACVSLAYNIGIGNFTKSTLLKKINSGDIEGAGKEFLKWDRANNVTMPGLLTRRLAEQALFYT